MLGPRITPPRKDLKAILLAWSRCVKWAEIVPFQSGEILTSINFVGICANAEYVHPLPERKRFPIPVGTNQPAIPPTYPGYEVGNNEMT